MAEHNEAHRRVAQSNADAAVLRHALKIIKQKLEAPTLTRADQDSLLRFINMLTQGSK